MNKSQGSCSKKVNNSCELIVKIFEFVRFACLLSLVLLIAATTVYTTVYADDDSMYVRGLSILCLRWK